MVNVKFSYTKLICLTSIINTRTPTSGDSKELMTTQAWHSEPHKCAPTHNWSNEHTTKEGRKRERKRRKKETEWVQGHLQRGADLPITYTSFPIFLVAHIISINITISLVHKFLEHWNTKYRHTHVWHAYTYIYTIIWRFAVT